MIRLEIIGNLGKDAILNDVSGKKVINFPVAIQQGFGDNETTLWVDVSKWGEKTGIVEFLKKGSKVFIAGEPRLRHWEKDGKSGTSLSLNVSEIELLGDSKKASE